MSEPLPDAAALLVLIDAIANPRSEAFELVPASASVGGRGEDFGRDWRMGEGPFAWRLSVPERFRPRSGDSAHEALDFPVRLEEAGRSIEAWAAEHLDPALAAALRLRFSRRETGAGHPLSVLVSTFVDAAPIDALRSKARNADPFVSLGEAFAAVSAAASLLDSGWLPDPPGAAWHHCEAYIHHDVGVKGTFGSSLSGTFATSHPDTKTAGSTLAAKAALTAVLLRGEKSVDLERTTLSIGGFRLASNPFGEMAEELHARMHARAFPRRRKGKEKEFRGSP